MIFSSCSKNKNIEGTWISAYQFDNESNKAIGFPLRNIFSFKNNKLIFRDFKYDYLSDTNIKKGYYKLWSHKLSAYVNNQLEHTNLIYTQDSLIFQNSIYEKTNIYKRLDNKLKSDKEIILSKKRFLITSKNGYRDTFYFINDSILRFDKDEPYSTTKWEQFKIDGYNILFIENDIPYVLNHDINGKIQLTGFHEKTYHMELNEINVDFHSRYYLINKYNYREFINKDLKNILTEYKNSIIDTIWHSEPPGVLYGVDLVLSNKIHLKINLKEIPKSDKFNKNLNWNLVDLYKCKVDKITLIEEK